MKSVLFFFLYALSGWLLPVANLSVVPFLSSPLDPEHQRANGNLKYFEYIMSKEKEANKSTTKTDSQTDKETKKKEPSKDYLPERQKYEMLCRGEGLRMVKWNSLFVFVFCLIYKTSYAGLI